MTAAAAMDTETAILLWEWKRRQEEAAAQAPATLGAFVEATTALRLEAWQQIICRRLDQLLDQTGQRILIHGPPQYGKSIIISQRFPAYALTRRPDLRIRLACYNVTHAERFSGVNLEILRHPSIALPAGAEVPSRAPIGEWSTAARRAALDGQPSMVALGLGTGFVGLGSDILIIDDPYKNAQDARSEAVNAMLWTWWTQVVLSRLNPSTNVVVMFHRWWEGDFAGRLMEQGGWEVLRFPAIADAFAHDPTGRAPGELLSPRYGPEYLEATRREMGTAFDALYQGWPVPADGALFKSGKVRFLDTPPPAGEVIRRVRRWDIASSLSGDFTAGPRMSLTRAGRYVVEDMVRGRWSPDERNAKIRETAERDGPEVEIVVPQDPGAAGVDMALSLVKLLSGFKVTIERETGDKVTRADPFASQWNAGNVDIVRAAWTDAYTAELLAFPNGAYDDQVDPSAGAFARLALHWKESGAAPNPMKPQKRPRYVPGKGLVT